MFRALVDTNKHTKANDPYKIKENFDYSEDYNPYKKYKGYGIVPPIYPSKILVNLVKLLTRIYEDYASKKVLNETKRLLNTLYNNKIITETVYNHLANI